MRDLVLAVKKEYFDQVKARIKKEEYRLANAYWTKRLVGRKERFRNVVITCGYPKKDDTERRVTFPYTGWERKTIQHKHFGSEPVDVFAIQLTDNPRF